MSWILSPGSAQESLQNHTHFWGTFLWFSSEPSSGDTIICNEIGRVTCVCLDVPIYVCVYTYAQRAGSVAIIVINLEAELAFLCIVTESTPSVTDVVMHLNKQV